MQRRGKARSMPDTPAQRPRRPRIQVRAILQLLVAYLSSVSTAATHASWCGQLMQHQQCLECSIGAPPSADLESCLLALRITRHHIMQRIPDSSVHTPRVWRAGDDAPPGFRRLQQRLWGVPRSGHIPNPAWRGALPLLHQRP